MDAAAGFAKGARETGLRVVQNSLFPPDADLTPIISGVASKKPDILAVGGHDTVLIDAVKAAKSVKFTPKAMIMHYGMRDNARRISAADDQMYDSLAALLADVDDPDGRRSFLVRTHLGNYSLWLSGLFPD